MTRALNCPGHFVVHPCPKGRVASAICHSQRGPSGTPLKKIRTIPLPAFPAVPWNLTASRETPPIWRATARPVCAYAEQLPEPAPTGMNPAAANQAESPAIARSAPTFSLSTLQPRADVCRKRGFSQSQSSDDFNQTVTVSQTFLNIDPDRIEPQENHPRPQDQRRQRAWRHARDCG